MRRKQYIYNQALTFLIILPFRMPWILTNIPCPSGLGGDPRRTCLSGLDGNPCRSGICLSGLGSDPCRSCPSGLDGDLARKYIHFFQFSTLFQNILPITKFF